MSLRVGFAEVDITPPLGAHKIGWLRDIVPDTVLDPLLAHVAVIEGDGAAAFVQLDALSVRWTTVDEIRRRVSAQYGFPGAHVMVAATHNHAGPAVANCGDVARDDIYVAALVDKVVAAFGEAVKARVPAEAGFGGCFEFGVSHNRRVLTRRGVVKTHGKFTWPDALCVDGPIDPEVAVLAARDKRGAPLGVVVNFTCHPTHHGGANEFSAGYPGALAAEMKRRGWPVTLFLNGASGNVSPGNPYRGESPTKEAIGLVLADDVARVVDGMEYRAQATVACRSRTIRLPYREPSEEQVKGTVRGAQRFVDPAVYDRGMAALVERIRTRGTQPAEVQVIAIDEVAFASIPAEYFVEHALRIKEAAHPRHALIVGHANGMVGYVPTKAAFARGGYETTFAAGSRLAPEAGDLLADCAIELIHAG